MAAQHSALALDGWRFVAGVGIGVELVTIDAYLVEIVPAGARGRVFAVNQAIQFAAVPVVAFACWLLVPRAPFHVAGWRWVVLLGAAAAIVVWFIRARLPESPRWLAGARPDGGGRRDRVAARARDRVRTGPLPAAGPRGAGGTDTRPAQGDLSAALSPADDHAVGLQRVSGDRLLRFR